MSEYIEFILKGYKLKIHGIAKRDGWIYLGEGNYNKISVFLDPFEGELIFGVGYFSETGGAKRFVYKFSKDELEVVRKICKPFGYPHLRNKNYINAFNLTIVDIVS